MSKNRIIIIANLSNDPIFDKNGDAILEAVTHRKGGETLSHKLRTTGETAKTCFKHAKKGTRVYAEGILTKKEIKVDMLQFLGGTC